MSSKNTLALEMIQLVGKTTEWTGIWDRKGISIRLMLFDNDKFSHNCEKLGLLSGYVFDWLSDEERPAKIALWEHLEASPLQTLWRLFGPAERNC